MTVGNFEGSLFPEKRRQIWARINSNYREMQRVEEGIKEQHYWNGWSNFSAMIGYNCFISAVTMGAAAAAAAWMARAAANGATWLRGALGGTQIGTRIARTSIDTTKALLKTVGQVSTYGAKGLSNEALIGASFAVFGRLTVGTLMMVINAYNSDGTGWERSKKEDWPLASRFCFMAFLAIFGNGAAKVPSGVIIRSLPKKLATLLKELPGHTASRQRLVQSMVISKNTIHQYMTSKESNDIWSLAKIGEQGFEGALDQIGAMTMKDLMDWAHKEEERIEQELNKKIGHRNFASEFSWNVRFGMWLGGDTDDYNVLCRSMVMASAKRDLWVFVGRSAEKIEAGIRTAKKLARKKIAEANAGNALENADGR